MALLFIEKISKKEDCNQVIAVFPFYKLLVYSFRYSIMVLNDKGGDGDEDVSNKPYSVKKKNDGISIRLSFHFSLLSSSIFRFDAYKLFSFRKK